MNHDMCRFAIWCTCQISKFRKNEIQNSEERLISTDAEYSKRSHKFDFQNLRKQKRNRSVLFTPNSNFKIQKNMSPTTTKATLLSLLFLGLLHCVQGQIGCSGSELRFPAPTSPFARWYECVPHSLISLSLLTVKSSESHAYITLLTIDILFPLRNNNQNSIDSWENSRGEFKAYPDDFEGVLNEVAIYQCPSRGVRVMISNGVPNHDVTLSNRQPLCEVPYVVEMPLNPVVAQTHTEIPTLGMIAMATNGVPAYGPMELFNNNAVEPTDSQVQGAGFWYGHPGNGGTWHFHVRHSFVWTIFFSIFDGSQPPTNTRLSIERQTLYFQNPNMGEETVTSDQILGYAMDGFPIYGPLEDDELVQLDACNGRIVDSVYQYHVRSFEQVDENGEYCNGESVETNWNYILGCYSGSVEATEIYNSDDYILDSDCTIQTRKNGKPKNNQQGANGGGAGSNPQGLRNNLRKGH